MRQRGSLTGGGAGVGAAGGLTGAARIIFSNVDWEDVEGRINRARDAFLRDHAYLLNVKINERTLTARFADYLRTEFPDWDVDPEFNRRSSAVKRLLWRDGATVPDDVSPDIIVHKRGTDKNLLVIEAKKDYADQIDDRRKVMAFELDKDFAYQYGVLLRFVTGNEPFIEIERV